MAQKQPTPFAILHTPPTFIHARVTKILAAAYLNDLTIVIPEDFAYGVTNKSPEFLAKFPMGKIPALETASGFLLAEGSAIAYYLADSGPKREQLLGKTPEERALVQMWCGLADSEIFPNMGLVVGPMLTGSPYDAKVVAEKEEAYLRALKRVELHLKGGEKWLTGGEAPSLADLSVAAALFWVLKFLLDGEAREGFPETMRWYTRLLEVDEIQKGFGGPPQLCEKRGPPQKKAERG
jgi:elongation factor 1-gamma